MTSKTTSLRRNSELAARASESAPELFRLLVESVQDYGIFLLDPLGYVASWNPGAARMKGYTADEIIGQHFSRFYPDEANARNWPAIELEHAAADGRFEDEGIRVRKDGTKFWANVVITALRREDGTLLGFAKITRDLSVRRRQEEALRRSEERFRLLVESVRDYAIFMLDENGYVASWNAGAQQIKGYAASEIIGEHFSRFYTPEALERRWPEFELQEARRLGRFEDEGYRVRKDGTLFWANVIITTLYDPDGGVRGFAKITRDLTERQRVKNLESDARQMNEFIAMLGHELRNPLAPIKNAAGILSRQPTDPGIVEWTAGVIGRQTDQLSRLVDDLLDVSRITRGKITIEKVPVALDEAVRRAIEVVRPQIDARHQTLVEKLVPVFVVGDAHRLTQIATNLLQNASKYTQDSGRIEVELFLEPARVLLHVRDNGIGLTPELLPRVFEMFSQGTRGLDRSEGGLGLGLTIVERLTLLHGGKVRARSDGPGRGSEFVVELPRHVEETLPAEAAPAQPAARAGKLRILVVDDNEDSAESMRMLLQLEGHAVEVAHDGDETLERLARETFDVALVDIGLPKKSGYEVAAEVRALPDGARMRLFAMTGYGSEDDRRRSFVAGFDDHFAKPVDLTALADALRAIARELGLAS